MKNPYDSIPTDGCTWLVQSLDITPRYVTNPNPDIGYGLLSLSYTREDAHVWLGEERAVNYAKLLGTFYVAKRARP